MPSTANSHVLLKRTLPSDVTGRLCSTLEHLEPDDIVLADRRQLKHYLYQQSYRDVELLPKCVAVTLLVVLSVAAAT